MRGFPAVGNIHRETCQAQGQECAGKSGCASPHGRHYACASGGETGGHSGGTVARSRSQYSGGGYSACGGIRESGGIVPSLGKAGLIPPCQSCPPARGARLARAIGAGGGEIRPPLRFFSCPARSGSARLARAARAVGGFLPKGRWKKPKEGALKSAWRESVRPPLGPSPATREAVLLYA